MTLEERIMAAFSDGATSDEVTILNREAEAATIAAGAQSEQALARALDPLLPSEDVNAARREMNDAGFPA